MYYNVCYGTATTSDMGCCWWISDSFQSSSGATITVAFHIYSGQRSDGRIWTDNDGADGASLFLTDLTWSDSGEPFRVVCSIDQPFDQFTNVYISRPTAHHCYQLHCSCDSDRTYQLISVSSHRMLQSTWTSPQLTLGLISSPQWQRGTDNGASWISCMSIWDVTSFSVSNDNAQW